MVNDKKIVAVTITKVESDIIESYVRHTLEFADELIVYDNGSNDGTYDILLNLKAEGLPLIIKRDVGNVEFNHSEIMTKLCFWAAERNAWLILPFDVDEFLISTEENVSIREILRHLPDSDVMVIPLIQYFLGDEYQGDNFILWNRCSRERDDVPQYLFVPKCIIPGKLVQGDFSLAQGCHFAESGGKTLKLVRLPFLHLAHFHYRSEKRYDIKTVLGWLGTICKYGENTPVCSYMKEKFQNIMMGKVHVELQSSKDNKEIINLQSYSKNHPIKYSEFIRVSLLSAIMQESVMLAKAYSEEKTKQLRKWIDVFLPYYDDDNALEEALKMIVEQTYPYCKIWIICMTKKQPKIKYSDKINCNFINIDDDWGNIDKKLSGEYVYWLMPGQKINARHIVRLLSNVELNGYRFRLCIPFIKTRNSGYYVASCKDTWKEFLSHNSIPNNGIQHILIPIGLFLAVRNEMLVYIKKRFVDYLGIWRCLLLEKYAEIPSQRELFFYHDSFEVCENVYPSPKGELMQKHLYWFGWLNHDNKIFTNEEISQIITEWLLKGVVLAENNELDENLLTEYKKIRRGIFQNSLG